MNINVRKLFSLDGHQDCVYTLESGKINGVFYSASGDGMVVEWNMNDPENGSLLVKMKNSVYALHFLVEENIMIAGQNFEGLHVVDLESRKEIGSLKISKAQIFDIKSHHGKLFVASADGTLYVVSYPELAMIKKIKLSDKSIRSVAINETLGELAIGLSDNSIRILDIDGQKQKYRINAHKLSVFAVTYNPKNNHLISASRDAHLKSWNPYEHYSLEHSVAAHMYAINSVSISPDQKHFISGSMDKSIKVWELDSFKLLKVIDRSRHAGHSSSVNKVLWTDYKSQVLSCGDDKKISIWDLSFI
jgi:WD40 repeat protein